MKLDLDQHGFLLDYQCWNEPVAAYFASLDGLELSQQHWQVIHYFRQFYLDFRLTPSMRVLIKHCLGLNWPQTPTSPLLQSLFPQGVMLQASKYAGLPKPKRCL